MVVQKIGDLTPTVIQDILRRSLANSSIQARTTLQMDGTQARSIDGNLSTGGRKQGLIISKKIFFIQLNEYETHPYFLPFFQSNMTVCLIIYVFCKSCELELVFVLICTLANFMLANLTKFVNQHCRALEILKKIWICLVFIQL